MGKSGEKSPGLFLFTKAETVAIFTGMKKIILIAVALVIIGCGTDSVTGTFCYEKKIDASDVYGTGQYSEYRAEFNKQTGCVNAINCNKYALIEECVDGTFTSK